MRQYNYIIMLAIAAVMALSSCNSKKKVVYLQDLVVDTPEVAAIPKPIKVEPGDKISISVSSSDPAVAAVFNLQAPASGGVNSHSGSGSGGGSQLLYTVSERGNIDFPVLGELHVAGLTRQQITEIIKRKLIEAKYVSDPVVTVEFANLHFTVLGDIGGHSNYEITDDHINIFEALAMAGDLTNTSERDQIYVIRTEDGVRNTMKLDVRSKEIFDSPAYYLKQNDIIYVVPNGKKAGEYSINENQWKSPGMYFSIFGFVTSVTSFIISITRK